MLNLETGDNIVFKDFIEITIISKIGKLF